MVEECVVNEMESVIVLDFRRSVEDICVSSTCSDIMSSIGWLNCARSSVSLSSTHENVSLTSISSSMYFSTFSNRVSIFKTILFSLEFSLLVQCRDFESAITLFSKCSIELFTLSSSSFVVINSCWYFTGFLNG